MLKLLLIFNWLKVVDEVKFNRKLDFLDFLLNFMLVLGL